MEEKHLARKKWVRRFSVIFFTVILLLTFFSNTIMNYSLPRVATQYIDSQTVSSKVRGTGIIEAGEEKVVTIKETRVIDKVMVSPGTAVKKGDVLITLTNVESEEIQTARRELENAKAAYDKRILVEEIDQSTVYKAENGGIDYGTSRVEIAALSANVKAASDKLAAAQSALDGYKAEEDEDGSKGQELQNAVATAQKEYEDAVSAHDKYISNINLIDGLKTEFESIKTLEDNLTKLQSQSTGNEIVAEFDGVVQAVVAENGKTVSAGEELLTMVNNSGGYTLSISVSLRESKKVEVGEEATIANQWYYGDAKATVTKIKNDPTNPGKQKIIVFNLTGELNAGDSMTVTVGQKNQEYDFVVPNSAIREDKDGNFVLIVKTKSTPLGNRYIARKLPVEILQSDDKNTAISGAIEYGEYVITTSSKMIQSGDLVRLED